jgi:hypothetical protein
VFDGRCANGQELVAHKHLCAHSMRLKIIESVRFPASLRSEANPAVSLPIGLVNPRKGKAHRLQRQPARPIFDMHTTFSHSFKYRSYIRLATGRQRSTTCPRSSTVLRTRTQSALSKALPDLALIDTTGKSSVSINDSIASLDEVGTARLPIILY